MDRFQPVKKLSRLSIGLRPITPGYIYDTNEIECLEFT